MRKMKGFTLIELLIVVAIIGIIAAIAIPNLLDAIERSRQRKSTAEVKTIANAIQAFSTDYGGYPAGPGVHDGDPANTLNENYVEAGPAGSGSPAFVPDYIQAIPRQDGWSVPYQVDFGGTVPNAQQNQRLGEITTVHFTLGCFGNDKTNSASANDPGAVDYPTIYAAWVVQPPAVPVAAGTLQTHCYATDIVWADSSFLQSPEGKQKNC